MIMMMMMIVTTIQDTLFLPYLRHILHYKSSDCSIYISLYRSAYLTSHSLIFLLVPTNNISQSPLGKGLHDYKINKSTKRMTGKKNEKKKMKK